MTTAESARIELIDSIVAYNKEKVLAAVSKARSVMKAEDIINALAAGMTEVGTRFERGKLFLPHVMVAADAMTAGVKLIEGDLPKDASGGSKAVIVNGTVEGDVHDIGKSIVSTMLQCAGYKVIDLGRDVPIRNFIETAKKENGRIIGMSSLMTTTMQSQKECIDLLVEEGIRAKVKVMVGGAPATQAWADKIGADAYGENAGEAVRKAAQLLA
ncbi:dimethylamine corrinoid protein MtbC [Methanomassiliicoccus luminyensis]|jgi:dimethylamine corrinoid protein|uniref:dimethylamine corrinoid protein MtbC n=1 Tax=Methanomassiliicoccus luminyensis TaxID=1080712 RepID=UPI0004751E19|nr:dimethylamine corrinoid protein MtbC [Methanomassiliicoccus luminyensis]